MRKPFTNYSKAYKRKVNNPLLFKLFLLYKLPMGLLSGMYVEELKPNHAAVSIPDTWLNRNPLKTTYFGSLMMVAEMSTALLVMMYIDKQKPSFSMLVADMEGGFSKKARGKITFRCENGSEIAQAVEKAKSTGEGILVPCITIGRDILGEEVCRFVITWTLKQRK